jgi:hypothetical protein
LHGRILFRLQRFEDAVGKRSSYFDFQGEFQNGYVSERLEEYSLWLSLGNSYEKVEQLLDRQTHDHVISSSQIQRLAVGKAEEISRAQALSVGQAEGLPMPPIAESIDLYDPQSAELVVFEDGILVKGQKKHRNSKKRAASSTEGQGKRPNTDMAVMPDGVRLIGGIGTTAVALWQVMCAHVKRRFASTGQPLRLVAITDGAKTIRNHFQQAFQVAIVWILDWYHLKKKVNELCILICCSKPERQQCVKTILHHCWVGEVDTALHFLDTGVKIRNQKVFEELKTYLTKHKAEIINYEKRLKAGKVIGSGRMESSVKQTVACRQKTKGMSWSAIGSKALAILTTQKLNNDWDGLWAFNHALVPSR